MLSFHSLEDRLVKHAFLRAAGRPTPDQEHLTYGPDAWMHLEEMAAAAQVGGGGEGGEGRGSGGVGRGGVQEGRGGEGFRRGGEGGGSGGAGRGGVQEGRGGGLGVERVGIVWLKRPVTLHAVGRKRREQEG